MTIAHIVLQRSLALAAVIAGGIALAGPALAGSCPSDKLRSDGSGEKMNATPAKDVSDAVLTQIDLAKEPAAVKDRLLRLRRLEIKPGGVVPWHSHGNRPAIIYVVQGEIVEYASTCAVPILHRAGETANSTWRCWRNPMASPRRCSRSRCIRSGSSSPVRPAIRLPAGMSSGSQTWTASLIWRGSTVSTLMRCVMSATPMARAWLGHSAANARIGY
jgi:hypothetical protein